MLDPEKDLGGQTETQSHGWNLCGGEAFREGILNIFIKTGDCDILRNSKSALFQKLEQNTAYVSLAQTKASGILERLSRKLSISSR